jgi:hypothetical protein
VVLALRRLRTGHDGERQQQQNGEAAHRPKYTG